MSHTVDQLLLGHGVISRRHITASGHGVPFPAMTHSRGAPQQHAPGGVGRAGPGREVATHERHGQYSILGNRYAQLAAHTSATRCRPSRRPAARHTEMRVTGRSRAADTGGPVRSNRSRSFRVTRTFGPRSVTGRTLNFFRESEWTGLPVGGRATARLLTDLARTRTT